VSGRLDPAEAARICGQAARLITGALVKERDAYARSSLASELLSLSRRMDAAAAARACDHVARILTSALTQENDGASRCTLAQALTDRQLDGKARELKIAMRKLVRLT
jgi:hypothetical protein